MAKKKTVRKRQNLVHITVTKEQREWLEELGGPTEGFKRIIGFWYSNFELWEEQEERRVKLRDRLNLLK